MRIKIPIKINIFYIKKMKCLKVLLKHLFNAHNMSVQKQMKITYILFYHPVFFLCKKLHSSCLISFIKIIFQKLYSQKMMKMKFKIFKLWQSRMNNKINLRLMKISLMKSQKSQLNLRMFQNP